VCVCVCEHLHFWVCNACFGRCYCRPLI